MSDTDDSSPPRQHTTPGLDLDAWVESYRRTGTERRRPTDRSRDDEQPADISPLTLLYTGFFLGPGATLVTALWLMGRGVTLRATVFAFGVCGAAWCSVQGATLGLAGEWSPTELQMLRTGVNFAIGMILMWFLRTRGGASLAHDRQTWINTIVVAALLVVGYAGAPDALLVWLGR